MQITSLRFANYKAFRAPTAVEVRPLTIIIGRNHAGKSALLRAVPLLVHSLVGTSRQILDLRAGGVRHGESLEELVHGRHVHGYVDLGLTALGDDGQIEVEARIQNLAEPGKPVGEVVKDLKLTAPDGFWISFTRLSLQHEARGYRVESKDAGIGSIDECDVEFEGLLPRSAGLRLSDATVDRLQQFREGFRTLAADVHYLQAQRKVSDRILQVSAEPSVGVGVDGGAAPQIVFSDPDIRNAVRDWFKGAMSGLTVDVKQFGVALRIAVAGGPSGSTSVPLENSGHGLSQLLPVVVQRLLSERSPHGLDLIEQPESDLHPGAHGAVADLFIEGVRQGGRPAILETHSEMFFLRVRRRIAEGRLDPQKVAIYWVAPDPEGGAKLQPIRLTAIGELVEWPDGVFYEDYDEVLAIRRAIRDRGAV